MRLKIATCIAPLFLLFSCQPVQPDPGPVKGSWYSRGYSQALIINSDQYELYDTYTATCVLKHRGELKELLPHLLQQNDTLLLFKGTSEYRFTKDHQNLASCGTKQKIDTNSVFLNYDAFAETVTNHFAYAGNMPVSTEHIIRSEREKLEENPSKQQLYRSMKQLLSLMNDNHGYLEVSEGEVEVAMEDEGEREVEAGDLVSELPEYGDFQVADRVTDMFLDEEYTRGTSVIRWGVVKDTLGYIQVKAMWLLADLELSQQRIDEKGFTAAYADKMQTLYEGTYIEEERRAAERLMDTIMTDLKDTRGLIIDVRFNGGGQDVVSMEILKPFNKNKRAVARKHAKFSEGYSDQQTIYLKGAKQPYLKPVFLLTSQQSASAADFLALASLQIPQMSRIGAHTQGALSDALEKRLPNGWYFSISNEVYFDLENNFYEHKGIAPDVEMDYPESRQAFFHNMMRHTLLDKARILQKIDSLYISKK